MNLDFGETNQQCWHNRLEQNLWVLEKCRIQRSSGENNIVTISFLERSVSYLEDELVEKETARDAHLVFETK